MTEKPDGFDWPAMMFARNVQEASEQAMGRQQEFFKQLMGGMDPSGFSSQLGAMSQTAMFKTRVQSGGRISIPDAEREALDIEEGDIVQTVIIPVKRNRRDTNE